MANGIAIQSLLQALPIYEQTQVYASSLTAVRTKVQIVHPIVEIKTNTISKDRAEKGDTIAISNKGNSKIIKTDFFIGIFYYPLFVLFQST